MFLGFILLIIGSVFLMKELGYLAVIDWGIIWPVILIAFGLSIMLNRPYNHERRMWKEMMRERKK